MYRVILGVDSNPGWKSHDQIVKDFKRFKIPESNSFVLDTASYTNAVLSVYNIRKEKIKKDSLLTDSLDWYFAESNANNDLQPVQIRYFDQNGKPLFKMINCYIDGYLKMSWNVDSCFDTFPPKSIEYLSYDTNENLDFFIPYIKTLNGESLQLNKIPKSSFYAIVFWNSYMRKPSKTLINQIRKTELNNPTKNTYIFYVNNHNASLWDLLDTENKKLLQQELEKH
tara:strand:+ start:66539 stop:67216 length:678 start_codon:yes stop_codon:yes gene_type:complete